jgi:hypothetical protein
MNPEDNSALTANMRQIREARLQILIPSLANEVSRSCESPLL